MNNEQQIAGIMTRISKEIVWPVVQQLAKENNYKVVYPFESKIGHGKKTYHTCKVIKMETERGKKNRQAHCVTYGKKMIASKFNRNEAGNWLSAREITEKNFYKGHISMETLLAHTILHEMAHVIQNIAGDRVYKSVHNAAFYKWLRQLHSQCGQQVLEEFKRQVTRHNIDLNFVESNVSSTGHRVSGLQAKDISTHKIYSCDIDKQPTLVKPFKINRKTVVVEVVKSKNLNRTEWKMSPHLLHETQLTKDDFHKTLNETGKQTSKKVNANEIKVLKKYKTIIKKKPVIVEVKKKNQKTVNAVIVDKASSFYGQTWQIPIQALESLK